jgi:hypothetical protein
MPPICRFAGILLFLAAAVSRAAAPDPLPDQPGALTREDIQAATEAMKARLGSGQELPLVASGKRLPGMAVDRYALFATPFVDYSARVKLRTRLLCFGASWRCPQPGDEFQMSANGIEHVFFYGVLQGTPDRQTAVDVVDFMYSPCFAAQFAALGGTPFTPSPDADYVRAVTDDGKGIGVSTGPYADNNSYRLQKTDKSADGCGFRIEHARNAKTGAFLPESYAKDMAQSRAKQEAEGRKQLEAEARARTRRDPPARATDEKSALSVMWGAALLGGLSLFVPLLTRSNRPWTRALAAGVLAVACTVMIVISAASVSHYDVPLQSLIYIAVLLTTWLVFLVLAIRAAIAGRVQRS